MPTSTSIRTSPKPAAGPWTASTPIILFTAFSVALAIGGAIYFPKLRDKYFRDRNQSLEAALNTFKQCVFEGASWAATISDPKNPAELRCLLDGKGCPNKKVIKNIRLSAVRATGGTDLCLRGYDTSIPTNGLTMDGQPCNGFSEGGSSSCPVRVEFHFVPHCSAEPGSPCAEAEQEVIFAIKHKPGLWSGDSTAGFSDGVDRPGIEAQQSFSILRGSNSDMVPITVAEVKKPGEPGGTCRQNGKPYGVRNLNAVVSDPAGYALAVPNSGGTILLRKGLYECRFSVPGYQVGGYSAVLAVLDTQEPLIRSGQEYAPSVASYSQTRAVGFGRFRLTRAVTPVVLVQYCADEPHGPAELKALAKGVPAGYGPEIFSLLQCRVLLEDT